MAPAPWSQLGGKRKPVTMEGCQIFPSVTTSNHASPAAATLAYVEYAL